jgi:hypothetical protein
MKITPEDLPPTGYTLLEKLDHANIIPFVKIYIQKKTRATIIYRIITFIIILSILAFFVEYSLSGKFNPFVIAHFFYGFIFTLLLLPLHEYIHVLAFRSMGAKKTSVRVNFKTLVILAIADKFVVNRKEFQVALLAPFVFITVILLVSLLFIVKFWIPAILGTLLFHTFSCKADMSLLSYLEFHKEKEIAVYDDEAARVIYFYAREKG